jgi:hypothetical protein
MSKCVECDQERDGENPLCRHCREWHQKWAEEEYEYWSGLSLAFGDWLPGCGEPMVPAGSLKGQEDAREK